MSKMGLDEKIIQPFFCFVASCVTNSIQCSVPKTLAWKDFFIFHENDLTFVKYTLS